MASNLGERDLIRRSATAELPPERRLTPVAKLIDVSKCIGCKACQSACVEWNDTNPAVDENVGVYTNPHDLTENMFTLMRFTEWVNPETDNLEWLIRKDGCMHCADPGCLKACPAPGAIVQYTNGIVDFIHENCIGCGYCVKGCPFNIPRISKADHRAYKCTLCSDRVAVGQGPACPNRLRKFDSGEASTKIYYAAYDSGTAVLCTSRSVQFGLFVWLGWSSEFPQPAKACPTHAIVFGTKEDMIRHAEGRIADLKSRGYTNAGLYDPPGVGGTHVMYVLHHNDKPHIYAGLPDQPRISPLVQTWKGVTKYVGLAAMGFLAAGS
ncbi:4Fe-4S dicluster domain-containing protein, partial [Roseomonas chloroacetimidivorans]|uniref:4Fe-4S dicluster domain-containing protein n=1 Tax=Roseomonas chloroacetimidivorans TaxID=1766656 RepID=UPI003C749A38